MPPTDIKKRLQQAGLRATSQRIAILEVLEQSEEHLDAEAIFQQARRRDPSLGLATVYRTLNRFKALGLVQQRYLRSDHSREYYERADKAEHYHFHCRGCGRIIELETARIRQAREELSARLGIRFTSACICFEGYCAQCAQGAAHEEQDGAVCTI